MEMSNDKTITETLPMTYGKWTIQKDSERYYPGQPRVIAFPTEEGIQHDYDFDGMRNRYTGNCLWADSIEEAKELIDERN